MKNMPIVLGAVLTMILFLTTACATPGTAAIGTTATTTVAATTTTLAPEATTTSAATGVHAWGEAVQVGDLTVTVAAPVEDAKATSVKEGEKVVYCTITIVNNGKDMFAYNPWAFALFDAENQAYDPRGRSSQPGFGAGDLAPGRTVKGAWACKMSKDALPAYMQFEPLGSGHGIQIIWGK